MSLDYDQYLHDHIGYVNTALRWMADNLSFSDIGITDVHMSDAMWNASDHDKSKYDDEEYDAYDRYFYGGNRSYQVVQDFNKAWLHHIHHNPHHWQYWVLIEDDPEEENTFIPLEMPIVYILEMIADWWAFSWKNGKLDEIFVWYADHENRIVFHKNTRRIVEDILNKIQDVLEMQAQFEDHLEHHGILGQKWGVRRFQNKDGTRTDLGKAKERQNTVFVSGSSKTQSVDSKYYREELPKDIQNELDSHMKKGDKIIVGDAPGVDRQVQDYLNKADYTNVEVYGPGKNVRYSANSKWKTNPIDDPDHEEGSEEWLAKKDKAMSDAADEGLAIILDEGAKATRKNIGRMAENEKDVKVFELSKDGATKDGWSIVNSLFEERRGFIDKKLDEDFDQELVDLIGMEIMSVIGFEPESYKMAHSDLEDDKAKKYGIPELKKFPMPDKRHVISAIKFFNYVTPAHEEELAKAILARIKEYGMNFDDFGVGDENRFKKYIPKEEDHLEHHGIKGQKWDVRNGPPYPLNGAKAEFNSPQELSNFMKSFKYSEYTKLQSPEETRKTKSGSCHDQVMYELDELRKQGYQPEAKFVIEYDPKTNQGGTTHSFVYFKDKGKTVWFENAWGGKEGLHEFDSEKDMENYIRNNWDSSDKNRFTGLEITDFKEAGHVAGESLQELVDICLEDDK